MPGKRAAQGRGLCALAAVCVLGGVFSAAVCAAQPAPAVRVSVLSLFRPRELVLRPAQGSALTLELGGQRLPLKARPVAVHASGSEVEAVFPGETRPVRGMVLRVPSTQGLEPNPSPEFWLEVPGKLRRRYEGALEIRSRSGVLEAVVTMPLETAVASVVAAESPPGAGLEALKAQAVAARSFFAARQTAHAGFDFCDTTHCQFLRSPPVPGSVAAEAARVTAGLVLVWHDEATARELPIAAMYARSCGGRTRTLAEIGAQTRGYPYYAVRCVYCSRHPEVWRREAARAESNSGPLTERDRLAYNRIHGWGAIPSLGEGGGKDGQGALTGRGMGHGVGLCQLGAADMARRGASFAQILAHYYPNTRLQKLPAP